MCMNTYKNANFRKLHIEKMPYNANIHVVFFLKINNLGLFCQLIGFSDLFNTAIHIPSPGLENSTHPLIFTSASGCRASENFHISSTN